ncbi:MAG: hypothetical protein IJR06_05640 [Paludibacteraceae bacterium]|nr:hypothetical protein [Paludibacteraceae bacterium]
MKYQKSDAYGSLSMPVYLTAAFEFQSAKAMSDAFCGRSMAPTALNTGMAAIATALMAVFTSPEQVE